MTEGAAAVTMRRMAAYKHFPEQPGPGRPTGGAGAQPPDGLPGLRPGTAASVHVPTPALWKAADSSPDDAAGQEPGRNEFRYGGMNRVRGIWSASTPPSTTRVAPVT
ncbi:hypothetical protein GCM10009734_26110 [Nonomuraea bangladeshensis]